jgi:aryl-alcohol dehydrogenase-like predicted oxidoreductase
MTDFRERRELGRTGLRVSRLGIGSSFGAPASVIERAFEQGINYLYWGTIRRPAFGRAMRHLARRHRDELVLTVQSYSRVPALVGPSVDVALLRSGLDHFDILLLGAWNARPPEGYVEAFQRLKEQGKVRFLAVSTHNRPLLPSLFQEFERGESPYDVFMVRYNAVHRGAEQEVFPFVPAQAPPGLIAYTATRWGHLLDARKMPAGEAPLRARDCYRFSLMQPSVDVVLAGPSDEAQMDEALSALEAGPLDPDQVERMRRIGDHIYGRYRPNFSDKGNGQPGDTKSTAA